MIEAVLESVLTTGKAARCEICSTSITAADFSKKDTTQYRLPQSYLGVAGLAVVFCVTDDTTDRVIGKRRLRALRDLAARFADATETEEACRIAADVVRGNGQDIPFALLYVTEDNGKSARLVSSVGLEPGSTASPRTVELQVTEMPNTWPLARVAATNRPVQVDNLEEKFGPLPGGPWIDSPQSALVLPIIQPALTLQLRSWWPGSVLVYRSTAPIECSLTRSRMRWAPQ